MKIMIGEKKKEGKYDEYEIKNCADTLVKAEEIKADKEKMALVSKELEKRKKAINRVPVKSMEELKERASEVSESDEEEGDE